MAKRSKAAFEDGQQARKFWWNNNFVPRRRVYEMSPEEVVTLILKHVGKVMGDWMQNNADVHAERGYFYVKLPYRTPLNNVEDDFWRKTLKDGVRIRRHQVGLVLRAIHGEVLTDA